MPFGSGHDEFYRNVLRKTIVAADYVPHRIDKDDYAGNIPSLFVSSLERARAVVIDLTGWNPNVMYELGQVHARGISPFLIVRHPKIRGTLPAMPFYLCHEKLIIEPDRELGRRRIAHELDSYLRVMAKANDGKHRMGLR